MLCTALSAAENTSKVDVEKTPWLKGVTIEMIPSYVTPVIPMKLYLENGEAIPKVITEDEPIVVQADSNIFFDDAPTRDRNFEIPNPRWMSKPSVHWQIIDWESNSSITCSSTVNLARNQMVVVPVSPSSKGALTCHVGRRMRYDDVQSGRPKECYANSSKGHNLKIKDITPPTCGLEITVKEGPTGFIYPSENPPNHFPLPKTADLNIKGALFSGDPEYEQIVSGYVLGPDMVAPAEFATAQIAWNDKVIVTVIGDDNYKLNKDKLRYGICNGAGGEPVPVCQENQPEYDFSRIRLPESPYFYLDATDMAGNREVLYIPIYIK